MRSAVLACLALVALAACDRGAGPSTDGGAGPDLAAPSQSPTTTDRVYAAEGEEATAATGALTVSETTRFVSEDAAAGGGDGAASGETVFVMTGANGVRLEATLLDTIEAGAPVAGQPLRAIMDLPLDAIPTLYRVTASEGGPALCGAAQPSHLVVWEATAGGDERFKLLVTTGGPPGDAAATLCQALSYRRAES